LEAVNMSKPRELSYLTRFNPNVCAREMGNLAETLNKMSKMMVVASEQLAKFHQIIKNLQDR